MQSLRVYQFCVVLTLCFCLGLASSPALPASNYQPQQSENNYDYLLQNDYVVKKSFHGLIRENETLVEITPVIQVDTKKTCSFQIFDKTIPFKIDLVNNLGIVRATRSLNCEKHKNYQFEITEKDCDGTRSTIFNMRITVVDINEYAPTFLQPSYVTEVDEGRLYKEIIRVDASDKDCTPLYGDVCKYEILNNDQPFAIDNEGSIKNTEPLSHKVSHNHILSVVAFDCAMKESVPIMVTIKVRRVCEARLLGIPERIDYTSSSAESLSLFPNARLELCDMYCNGENLNIHTSIALKTKHISFGCDRDVSRCNAGRTLIDLLPRGADWTNELNSDEGAEPVFRFDGASGVIVPDSLVAHHDFSLRPFSIVTIFRHSKALIPNKHAKEHIICSADDHKMNRHHMAVFIRNCRLILLLRKNEGDLNIFSPAEWRWNIPQVCDGEWHYYVLNVDPASKIELYIDGVPFESSAEDRHNNPEVIDDWPLHAAHGINTTLWVGACYQSSENRLKHGFNGSISEIKVSLDEVLAPADAKCGMNCAEHLLPPPEKLQTVDSEIQTNAQLNEIDIEGENKLNVELLLQNIQYINTKRNPTIGRRNIQVRTTMMCINQSAVRLPTVDTYIMVNEPTALALGGMNGDRDKDKQKEKEKVKAMAKAKTNAAATILSITEMATKGPLQRHNGGGGKGGQQQHPNDDDMEKAKIIITGNSNDLVSYAEIKHGVHILGNINITVATGNEVVPSLQKLDWCNVTMFPPLNPDHEDIQVNGDESLSATLDIKTNINKDGVEIIGYDTTDNYLDVLRALVYSNKKPAYYLNRVFELSCSQLNSQFKSAEFTLTLTVLHPKQVASPSTTAPAMGGGGDVSNNEIVPNGIVVARSKQQQMLHQEPSQHLQEQPQDAQQQSQTQYDGSLYSHAMTHSHDVQESKSRLHSIVHKAESSHPTMLIILIGVFFVILLCGVLIARLRNSNQKYVDREQPCQKIADESLVWDDSALTITINPMQNDAASEDSSDSENSDSDEDEVVNGHYANMNQLEWDNSNIFNSTVN